MVLLKNYRVIEIRTTFFFLLQAEVELSRGGSARNKLNMETEYACCFL